MARKHKQQDDRENAIAKDWLFYQGDDLGIEDFEHVVDPLGADAHSFGQDAPHNAAVTGAPMQDKGHSGKSYTYGQKRGESPSATPAEEVSRGNNPYEELQDAEEGEDERKGLVHLHEALGEDAHLLDDMLDDDCMDDSDAEKSLQGHEMFGAARHGDDGEYGQSLFADDDFDDDDFDEEEEDCRDESALDPAEATLEKNGHTGQGGYVVGAQDLNAPHDDDSEDPEMAYETVSLESEESEEEEDLGRNTHAQEPAVDEPIHASPAGTTRGQVADVPREGQAGFSKPALGLSKRTLMGNL